MFSRPRSRRTAAEIHLCMDCEAHLCEENWSPSMRGETGQRTRRICRTCWSTRQREYANKKPKDVRNAEKKASRDKRHANWSADRKEIERQRRYATWLKRKYGITIEQYEIVYLQQKGKCKICNTSKPRGRGGFHVDHCHDSGKVRGLLCASCNMMLGLAKDDLEVLKRAIDYLKR